MAKNRMAEVAKLLGLELGEEFDATRSDGSEIGRYRFTEENLENWVAPDSEWMQEDATIADLLNGTYEIEKKPKKTPAKKRVSMLDERCRRAREMGLSYGKYVALVRMGKVKGQ